jgi:hypothetical protein
MQPLKYSSDEKRVPSYTRIANEIINAKCVMFPDSPLDWRIVKTLFEKANEFEVRDAEVQKNIEQEMRSLEIQINTLGDNIASAKKRHELLKAQVEGL